MQINSDSIKPFLIRWGALLGTGIAAFFAGHEYAKEHLAPQVQVVNHTQTVDKVVNHTVTVRETAPNGTVKETTTTDTTQNKVSEATVKAVEKAIRKEWAVGLGWSFASYIPVEANIDRRLLGDLWLTAGANWSHPQLTLGVKYEF